MGAAYFLNEYRDLVDFDFEQFLHVNRARVRTQGVELTARWRPLATLWLDRRGHLPRCQGRLRRRTAPPVRASVARWRQRHLAAHDRRSVSVSTPDAVSRYLDNQIPVPDQDSVPGYGLFGFAGSWRFHRGWSVRARLDNLAGRRYETLIGIPGPGTLGVGRPGLESTLAGPRGEGRVSRLALRRNGD